MGYQYKTIHKLTLGVLFIICASFLLFFNAQTASAVTGGDWRAGNIIDDVLFYDNSSMTADEIQNFMNSKVTSCDTNGTQSNIYNPGITNAEYAAQRGWPAPPYICLRDYRQMPRNDQVISNFTTNLKSDGSDGSVSAAQIIKNAADSYNISPKALLTTLQKESLGPLLTDNWPLLSQYKNAMGYGCPDTAPCDAKYEGFYNQMMNAAWQFNYYKNNPASFRYKPFQNNDILFSPNGACGSSTVYIETRATAGLYNYTPYQPNAAALAAAPGQEVYCGAYGNINFWRIFNNWFGSTYGTPYKWSVVSQTYKLPGSTEQPYDNGVPVDAGDVVTLKFVIKNIGTRTWYQGGDNPVRLATWGPSYRTSQFQTDSWISPYRVTGLQEASVAPGQNGTFIFTAKATKPGNYGEYFNLVAEGAAWFPDNGIMRFNFNVHMNYRWQIVSQTFGQSEQVYDNGIPADFRESIPVTIRLKNIGDVTWHNNGDYPVKIATWDPPYHESKMYDPGWAGAYRPTVLTEASVPPGNIGTFKFNILASRLGNYGEYFNLVSEGAAWFPATQMLRYNLNVRSNYRWQIVSQSYGATDPVTPYDNGISVAPGGAQTLRLVVKNIGNTTWNKSGDNPVRIATWDPSYRNSAFQDSSWISPVRVVTHQEETVAPGQNATFIFTIKAPLKSGNYGEYFNLVCEGAAWFPTNGIMRFNFNVWP